MYGSNAPVSGTCPSLEDQIAELHKQIEVDKNLLNAMDKFADLHGEYSLNELDILGAYGNLVRAIKMNTKDMDKLLQKQEKIND